jgi:preprotein translocase subunit SecF
VQSANGLFSLARQDEGEPCDRIYFADGSQAEVKVLELNDKEVVYRRCNEPNAPVIILNKKHITKIEFSSGERYEEVKEEGQEQNNRQEEVQKSEESTNQSQNQTQKSGQALAKEGIVNILALFFAITGLVMLILAFLHSWYWLFGAAIFSALGASLGWFGINKPLKGLGIVALIIGTVCSILSSVLFGLL